MVSKGFKIFIYFFLGLIFSILMVGFKVESVMAAGLNTDYVKVTVEHTPAGPPTAHNVSGWAWSENIGWISFSCDNPEFPNCTNDYGVDVDENTGIFSGYAWSDNIGWISFNRSDTGTPPTPPYNGTETFVACLDFPGVGQSCDGVGDYKVSGWAKTINTGDGWDGWISLRGVAQDSSTYGVFLNGSTNELEGWAWSDNIGWISFNCNNPEEVVECGTSNYKVKYSPPPNQPPTCTSLSVVPTQGATPLNVSFIGEGSDSDGAISQYEFDFGNGNSTTVFPGFCTGDINCDLLGSCLDDCQNCGCSCYLLNCSDCPGPIPCQGPTCSQFTDPTNCEDCPHCSWFDDGKGYVSYTYNSAGTYCAKLRVQDDDGAWSTTPGDCPDVCAEQIIVEINNPPTAAFSCDSDPATCGTSGCTGYTGCLFRLENKSTDTEGEGDIASSTWVITGPTSERITCMLNPLCDWPLQPIHPAGIYTATLKVEDQSGAEHTSAPQNFTIYQEAIADFMCSFKEDGPWQPCQNFKLLEGEVIYFSDDSEASEGGGSITQRTWEFKGGEPNSILGNETMASTTFIYTADPEFGKAILTVQDQAGRTNTITYNLLMTAPSPEWKEVPPF